MFAARIAATLSVLSLLPALTLVPSARAADRMKSSPARVAVSKTARQSALDPRTVALLRRVQAAYRRANTLTADFTYSVTSVKRQQLIEGRLRLKKPNLARVAVTYLREPAYPSLIGSDGKAMFVFTPESFDSQTRRFRATPFDSVTGAQQASGTVPGGGTIASVPVAPDGSDIRLWDAAPVPAFFSPMDALRNTLYVSDPNRMQYEGKQTVNGVTYEVLRHRYQTGNIAGGENSAFDQRLYIGPDSLIHQYVLEFRSGGRPGIQVVRLENIRINVPLNDADFAFTAPGTTP